MDDATVSTLLSDCGSTSGSKLLCCLVAILGREAAQNTDNIIALCALVTKQLQRIATDSKSAERLKDPTAFPDDADRSLTAPRATLLEESLSEIVRSSCALGGEYYPGRDISMIASSLNLVQIRINQFPASYMLQ